MGHPDNDCVDKEALTPEQVAILGENRKRINLELEIAIIKEEIKFLENLNHKLLKCIYAFAESVDKANKHLDNAESYANLIDEVYNNESK